MLLVFVFFYSGFIFNRFNPEILIYIGNHFKINIAYFFSLFFFFWYFLFFLFVLWIRWFLWFYYLRNDNDNFSNYFLIVFFIKIFCFFFNDFSWRFNYFNCFDSNVNNNFNCYSNDNDNNMRIDFQLIFSSFCEKKITTYFCYMIIDVVYINWFTFFYS